jgi:hypothetical protein
LILDLLRKTEQSTFSISKTAKPNAGGFKEFKRTLLEWVAASFANDPTVNVQSLIAIRTIPMIHNHTIAGQ